MCACGRPARSAPRPRQANNVRLRPRIWLSAAPLPSKQYAPAAVRWLSAQPPPSETLPRILCACTDLY